MIESVTIEGRKASMAYLSALYVPCLKQEARFAQILYDDGGTALIAITPPKIEVHLGGRSSRELFSRIFKYNKCRVPGGSSQGGQFCSSTGNTKFGEEYQGPLGKVSQYTPRKPSKALERVLNYSRDGVAKGQEVNVEAAAERQGKTVEVYKEELTKQIRDDLKDAKVYMRVGSKEILRSILEGGLKNQYETQKSGGLYNPEVRLALEEAIFDYDDREEGYRDRPVYGYAGHHHLSSHFGVASYGAVIIEFKDRVREDSTVTVGDSLTNQGIQSPTPMNDPSYRSYATSHGGYVENTNLRGNKYTYTEVQIHNRPKIEDIAKVYIPEGTDPGIGKELDNRGIPWEFYKPPTLMDDFLPNQDVYSDATPVKKGLSTVFKFNKCHLPPGTPQGGQFCSGSKDSSDPRETKFGKAYTGSVGRVSEYVPRKPSDKFQRMFDNPTDGYEVQVDGRANIRGVDGAEFRAKLQEVITNELKNAKVYMRVDSDVLGRIISDGFKNQYESQKSNGLYAPSTRLALEVSLFGYDNKMDPDSAYDRPIYGYAGNSELDSSWGVGMYGNVIVEFKDNVREDSTITVNDSLAVNTDSTTSDRTPRQLPSPFNDPSYKSFPAHNNYVDDRTIERLVDSYYEVQIHRRPTIKDIAKVYLPHSMPKEAIEAVEKAGIPWEFYKAPELFLDDDPY